MAVENFPKLWKMYHVYCVLCQDKGGPLYVKFGHSRRIWNRMLEVRSASPIPAKWFGYVRSRGEEKARKLEKRLHANFAHRKTRGEWFRFDAKCPKDKKEFNDGCREAIFHTLGDPDKIWWEKARVADVDSVSKWRAKAMQDPEKIVCFAAPPDKGGLSRRRAWKELGS